MYLELVFSNETGRTAATAEMWIRQFITDVIPEANMSVRRLRGTKYMDIVVKGPDEALIRVQQSLPDEFVAKAIHVGLLGVYE